MEPEISKSKVSMTVEEWARHKNDLESLKEMLGVLELRIENVNTQNIAKDKIIERLKTEHKREVSQLTVKYNTTMQTLRAKESELELFAKTQGELHDVSIQLATKDEQLKAYAQVLTFLRNHVLEINTELKEHSAEDKIKILQDIVKNQIKIFEGTDWSGLPAEAIAFKRGLPVQDEEPGAVAKVGGKTIVFKEVQRLDGFPADEEPEYK